MSKQRRTTKTPRRRSAATPARKLTRRSALAAVKSAKKTVRERTDAVAALAPSSDDVEQLTTLITVVGDRSAPLAVRFAALESLGAARFSSPAFPAHQSQYVAALRKIVDDADPEMRQRVLGILAREKDAYAQKRLLDGLRDPSKALVPPEKALQLLGYDVHAEVYPIAREIARNPPNPLAKREALRVLAADSASAPLFEEVLRDKAETPEIRQIGAAALHALQPERLQAHAREILLDPAEQHELQQTSLTALTHFGPPSIAEDSALLDSVEKLGSGKSTSLRDLAQRFRAKYRP